MQTPKHVCILTSAHALDDVRVNNKIAYSLKEAGIKVTWVGPHHSSYDKEYYNRYGLTYNLFFRPKGRFGRLKSLFLLRKIASSIKDVDYYYSPEPDSAFVAITLATFNKRRVILDIHEMYHEYMLAHRVKGWRQKCLSPVVRWTIAWICRACELVIGVCENVLAPYQNVRVEKMVIRSCAPKWFAQGDPSDVCGKSRSYFTVMQGKSTLGRGTETILQSLSLAKDHIPNLRVIMFNVFDEKGDHFGASQFTQKVEELGLTNVVDFRKPVPMQEMPSILKSCDLGLVSYNRQLASSLPNKVFEYMACGLPILAQSYSKEVATIVEKEQCGLLVDFEDPYSIAEAIIYLYNHQDVCREFGKRAYEAFLIRNNWENEVVPLIEKITTS